MKLMVKQQRLNKASRYPGDHTYLTSVWYLFGVIPIFKWTSLYEYHL